MQFVYIYLRNQRHSVKKISEREIIHVYYICFCVSGVPGVHSYEQTAKSV